MKSSNENDAEEENGDRVVFFVGGEEGKFGNEGGGREEGGAVKNPPRSSVKITFKIPQEEVCKLRAKRTRQR